MQRPDPREFLRSVLNEIEELPDGFAARLEELVHDHGATEEGDRADSIQKLIEESTR